MTSLEPLTREEMTQELFGTTDPIGRLALYIPTSFRNDEKRYAQGRRNWEDSWYKASHQMLRGFDSNTLAAIIATRDWLRVEAGETGMPALDSLLARGGYRAWTIKADEYLTDIPFHNGRDQWSVFNGISFREVLGRDVLPCFLYMEEADDFLLQLLRAAMEKIPKEPDASSGESQGGST